MESELTKDSLKRLLLKGVARLCCRDEAIWKEPIVDTLRDLQAVNARAVFFGGTLRSLLVGRIAGRKFGRPRDIDIVVADISLETLRAQFESLISRETRFGGLQLRRREWHFDVWPLQKTWAFVSDHIENPAFDALPATTFFNLEAIAVEIWAQPGRPRKIFSGDDQFFDGILKKTLEINREENPFPSLCVTRALVMSAALEFAVGPRLAGYIACHGEHLNARDDMDELQHKHYGVRRIEGRQLREWICFVAEQHARLPSAPVRLPISRQLELRFAHENSV